MSVASVGAQFTWCGIMIIETNNTMSAVRHCLIADKIVKNDLFIFIRLIKLWTRSSGIVYNWDDI